VIFALQDSARHARYLMLRTARHISARFTPSFFDWATLCPRRPRPSTRVATSALPADHSTQLSMTQDLSEARAAKHDHSRDGSAYNASSDHENGSGKSQAKGETIEHSDRKCELQVTVDSVSAFDESEERIHCRGDGGAGNGESQCLSHNEKSHSPGAESCDVREAWPSGQSRANPDGPVASGRVQEEITSALILPLAEIATLDETPNDGCALESVHSRTENEIGTVKEQQHPIESILHPEEAGSSYVDCKAPSMQKSKVVAQLVAMYEVYVRSTLQV
jgi:hypothetical protein